MILGLKSLEAALEVIELRGLAGNRAEVADLLQPCDQLEDVRHPYVPAERSQPHDPLALRPFVGAALLAGEFQVHRHVGLGRQVPEDVDLAAAQLEFDMAGTQGRSRGKAGHRPVCGPRSEELADRGKIVDAVLQRGARERPGPAAGDPLAGDGSRRCTVLDALRLVQDDDVPEPAEGAGGVRGQIGAHRLVAGEVDVSRAAPLPGPIGGGAADRRNLELGGPFSKHPAPLGKQTHRCDDQGSGQVADLPEAAEGDDGLHRFAEAHVVGQQECRRGCQRPNAELLERPQTVGPVDGPEAGRRSGIHQVAVPRLGSRHPPGDGQGRTRVRNRLRDRRPPGSPWQFPPSRSQERSPGRAG